MIPSPKRLTTSIERMSFSEEGSEPKSYSQMKLGKLENHQLIHSHTMTKGQGLVENPPILSCVTARHGAKPVPMPAMITGLVGSSRDFVHPMILALNG